jgi:membrane protein implicated in regulation of membrane protease activity
MMVGLYETVGLIMMAAGALLLAFELVHPGALLLIPASVLIVGGVLLIFFPDVLLASPEGPILIVVAAAIAGIIEIPYYRWMSPGHLPMTSMPTTLIGREGIVVSEVLPNSLKGKVRIDSEVWSARSPVPIPAGTAVRVVGGEGVSVLVAPSSSPPTVAPGRDPLT